MSEITLIHQTLHQHFGWHGARLRFLTLFLMALFRVRTVNLSPLSIAKPSKAQADSRSKRYAGVLFNYAFLLIAFPVK